MNCFLNALNASNSAMGGSTGGGGDNALPYPFPVSSYPQTLSIYLQIACSSAESELHTYAELAVVLLPCEAAHNTRL